MKITFDTKTDAVKAGGKPFDKLKDYKKDEATSYLKKFIRNNTRMSDYELDAMWMSYRYCIGRHTIAAHMHAHDIWENCKGRMTPERQRFTAFDINREIEDTFTFIKPRFHFAQRGNGTIITAVDVVCEFIKEHDIKSKDEFIKYKDINVILTDNERGYKFETTTWKEWEDAYTKELCKQHYLDEEHVKKHIPELASKYDGFKNFYHTLQHEKPNPDNYYMTDFEDLFVWNDLVKSFDKACHHKSILTDGTECEWFWSWRKKTNDDGFQIFGYEGIRVPIDGWNGSVTKFIPTELIKEEMY